jgi:hypothetical protein
MSAYAKFVDRALIRRIWLSRNLELMSGLHIYILDWSWKKHHT